MFLLEYCNLRVQFAVCMEYHIIVQLYFGHHMVDEGSGFGGVLPASLSVRTWSGGERGRG